MKLCGKKKELELMKQMTLENEFDTDSEQED